MLYNLSGFQLQDKEDIETFKTEDINGKEVAGKEGVPVRREKLFPGKARLNITGFPKVAKHLANGFMGNVNGKLAQFIPDTAGTPEGVFLFKF